MQWTPHQNTNVYDGIYDVASTLEDCQAACVNNLGCNGIDYVAGNRPQSRCWLSGTWSGSRNNGTAPGVTHYDYDRTCQPGMLYVMGCATASIVYIEIMLDLSGAMHIVG